MLNVKQFREFIIRPTLKYIGLWSEAAENLVVGTALQESGLHYLDQTIPGPGPAYGLFQMERATHDDLRRILAKKRPEVAARVESLLGVHPSSVEQLATNLAYGAAMCRVHYLLRDPDPLPAADDLAGLARTYKANYNTRLGKATPQQFIDAYRKAHR